MKTVSWEEVAKTFRFKVKPKKKYDVKPIKCAKCGGVMTPHYGTNVFTCSNMIEVETINEDGSTVKSIKPCGNFYLRNNII